MSTYLDSVRRVGRSLKTDQRAGILLVAAPDICDRLEECLHNEDRLVSRTSGSLGDSSDIDVVLRLGRGQLGDYGKEEETDTTHLDRFSV